MVKVIEGDIAKASEEVIGHQTNCKGYIGFLAKLILVKLFPECEKPYRSLCKSQGSSLLGTSIILPTSKENKFVANIFGQDDIVGHLNGGTDLASLENALHDLKRKMLEFGKHSLALPYKLGCGKGGASWKDVSEIIETTFGFDDLIDVVIYKKYE